MVGAAASSNVLRTAIGAVLGNTAQANGAELSAGSTNSSETTSGEIGRGALTASVNKNGKTGSAENQQRNSLIRGAFVVPGRASTSNIPPAPTNSMNTAAQATNAFAGLGGMGGGGSSGGAGESSASGGASSKRGGSGGGGSSGSSGGCPGGNCGQKNGSGGGGFNGSGGGVSNLSDKSGYIPDGNSSNVARTMSAGEANNLLSESKQNPDKVYSLSVVANWCGACAPLKTGGTLDGIAKQFSPEKVTVGRVFLDQGNQVAGAQIGSFPTTLIIKDGKVVDQVVGANDKSIVDAIGKQLPNKPEPTKPADTPKAPVETSSGDSKLSAYKQNNPMAVDLKGAQICTDKSCTPVHGMTFADLEQATGLKNDSTSFFTYTKTQGDTQTPTVSATRPVDGASEIQEHKFADYPLKTHGGDVQTWGDYKKSLEEQNKPKVEPAPKSQ